MADTANTTATTNTAEATPPEPQARHVIYCSGKLSPKIKIPHLSAILVRKKANLYDWPTNSLHPTSRGELTIYHNFGGGGRGGTTPNHHHITYMGAKQIQYNFSEPKKEKKEFTGWYTPKLIPFSIANSVVQRRNARNGLRPSIMRCTNGYTPKVWIETFSSFPLHTIPSNLSWNK